jgi:hypothetical protein
VPTFGKARIYYIPTFWKRNDSCTVDPTFGKTNGTYKKGTDVWEITMIRYSDVWEGAQCFGIVFLLRSRVSRASVRFFAAASDAFFARAERSSGVMVSRLRLPPREPMSAITCRTKSRGILFPID